MNYIFIFSVLVSTIELSSTIVTPSEECSCEDADNPNQANLCVTGKMQSPINIVTAKAEWKNMTLDYTGFEPALKWCAILSRIQNTVRLYFKDVEENKWLPTIAGDGIHGKHELLEIYFYWGSNHLINGIRYPLEMTMNFYSPEGSVSSLAILLKVSRNTPERNFRPITSNLPIMPDDKPRKICGLDLTKFFPANKSEFYRYKGSTLTPPCSENVTWTIYKDFTEIFIGEFNALINIADENGNTITTNFKEVQPLNDRKIYFV